MGARPRFRVREGRVCAADRRRAEGLEDSEDRGVIDVQEFVPIEAVEPVYFERTYYLGPPTNSCVGP
jgi:non-homologous end joining protein Ku